MRLTMLLLCLAGACVLASALALAAEGPPAVEIHGYVQTRYYINVTEDAVRTPDGVVSDVEKTSFLEPAERVSLSGLARLPENRIAYAEVYVHHWLPSTDQAYLYLESLYLDSPQAPGVKFRIGKGRDFTFGLTPVFGTRKTSNYSAVAEAFTQDRVLGFQYLDTRGKNTFNLGVFNSERVGQRFSGMTAGKQLDEGSIARTTVPHLAVRDLPADRSGALQGSARLARQLSPTLSVGISGRLGNLDNTDRAFLAKHFVDKDITSTRRQYGLDAVYSDAPWYATAEYYGGSTGGVGQTGWQVLLGVEPSAQCTLPWRSFSSACKGLYVRYGELKVNSTPTVDPLTWDTKQFSASYVFPFKFKGPLSGKWLQFEYERNTESPPAGVSDIPNNVMFLELFTAL